MRRSTLIVLIALSVALAAAAAWQIGLASRSGEPFEGPVPGTPLPHTPAS